MLLALLKLGATLFVVLISLLLGIDCCELTHVIVELTHMVVSILDTIFVSTIYFVPTI